MGDLQQAEIVLVASDDLQADWQSFAAESAGNGEGRGAGDGDAGTGTHPVDVGVEFDAVDFGRVGHGHIKRQYLDHGCHEEIVLFHELAHAMEQLRALHFRRASSWKSTISS